MGNYMYKISIGVAAFVLMSASTLATAGDAENIDACVKKAKNLAGVTLDPFAASYEGNVFSMSTVKWSNAFCEVKFADVYILQINERQIIYKGYAGKESYDLNQKLQERTENAINQLNSRIALLRQRAEQVSEKLKQANPGHGQLTRYVDEGIAKSLGGATETGK